VSLRYLCFLLFQKSPHAPENPDRIATVWFLVQTPQRASCLLRRRRGIRGVVHCAAHKVVRHELQDTGAEPKAAHALNSPVDAVPSLHPFRGDELAAQGRGIGVVPLDDLVEFLLGITHARLEVLNEPLQDHVAFLPAARNLDEANAVHKGLEHLVSRRPSLFPRCVGASVINC